MTNWIVSITNDSSKEDPKVFRFRIYSAGKDNIVPQGNESGRRALANLANDGLENIRHGNRHVKVSGKENSADREAAKNVMDVFNKMVVEENLSLSHIYNVDETELFWKCIPRNTLAANQETNISGWKEKERVTVLCCRMHLGHTS